MSQCGTVTRKKDISNELKYASDALLHSVKKLEESLQHSELNLQMNKIQALENEITRLNDENAILSKTLHNKTRDYEELKAISRKVLEELDKSIEDLVQISGEDKNGNS